MPATASWKPSRPDRHVASQPSRANLEERIAIRLAGQLHLPTGTRFDRDQDLAELGLRSLNTIVFVIGLEEEFGVSFPDESLVVPNFRTLNTIAALVEATL